MVTPNHYGIIALVLVALMLLLAYRRVGQTVVALLPLLLTIAVLLAFIAASGIQLNILTAIISSRCPLVPSHLGYPCCCSR